eukprot:3762791-Rhodomonas_salina.1
MAREREEERARARPPPAMMQPRDRGLAETWPILLRTACCIADTALIRAGHPQPRRGMGVGLLQNDATPNLKRGRDGWAVERREGGTEGQREVREGEGGRGEGRRREKGERDGGRRSEERAGYYYQQCACVCGSRTSWG